MSTKSEKASEFFENGFNCSQSVFAVFCEKYGLPQEKALKIACGFGGGMRNAEICGAVSGAVMVIGLHGGQCMAGDMKSKADCYAKTLEFTNKFRENQGSIICREILGLDICTSEGFEQAKNQNMFTTKCVSMVVSAVEILESMGY
jgi:C_GCAxxG_C_C family probable redox protein